MLSLWLTLGALGLAGAAYPRLGKGTIPLAYRLHLHTDMSQPFTYNGKLSLELRMLNTSEFWLDCDRDLEVISSRVIFDEDFVVNHKVNRTGDRLLVTTERKMKSTYAVLLEINFTGAIRKGMAGFYLSSYTSSGTKRCVVNVNILCTPYNRGPDKFPAFYAYIRKYNDKFYTYYRMSMSSFDHLLEVLRPFITKEDTSFKMAICAEKRLTVILRWMGSTQFESMGARLAFPCFDEPAFRSRFSLQISVPSGWQAISNTPVINDTTTNGSRTVEFAEMESTPVYLVGWAVFEEAGFAKLDQLPVPLGCGAPVDFRIWANADYRGQQQIARAAGPLLVQALQNFTGISCKAVKDKMDFVAIPDFSAGAMENWGIITYREAGLLFDQVYSTAVDRQQIVMVIGHELAHQWFGNLVTPEWWGYVWLSEGFARFLQYFVTNKILPALRLDEQFLVGCRQTALEQDGPSARPLTKEVLQNKAEIENMFDFITYDKGAALINMWKSVIGEDEFKKGIRNYLTSVDGAGGVATPDLFFSSFPSLPAGLRRWSETPGYPVLVVDETPGSLSVRQIKVTGWNQTEPSDWLVPISINIDGVVSWYHLQPNATLNITLPNNTNYFLLNVNQTGYYRVLYKNPVRWLVATSDRSQLVDDAMALAYSGLLSYQIALGATTSHLRDSLDDYFAWSSGLRSLQKLAELIEGTDLEANFTEAVLSNLIDKAYNELNGNATSHLIKIHQMNVMKHACYYGFKGCLNDANTLANNIRVPSLGLTAGLGLTSCGMGHRHRLIRSMQYIELKKIEPAFHKAESIGDIAVCQTLANPVVNNSDPEKRSALICSVVQQGNQSTWEMIWNRYMSAKSPAESQLFLKSLACTLDRGLIKRSLNLLLTDQIRIQDIPTMFSLISSRKIGAAEAFLFFKNNYTQLSNHLQNDTRNLHKIIASVSKNFNETQLYELKNLALDRPELNLNSTISSLEKSISWRKKVYQQLKAYLRNEPIPTEPYNPQPTGSTSTTPTADSTGSSSSNIHLKNFSITSLVIFFVMFVNFIF